VLTCPRIRAAVTSGFYTEIAAQPKATNGRQYPACLARTKPAIAYRVFSLVVSRGGRCICGSEEVRACRRIAMRLGRAAGPSSG